MTTTALISTSTAAIISILTYFAGTAAGWLAHQHRHEIMGEDE